MKKYGKLYRVQKRASILATMYSSAATELMKLTITGGENPDKKEAKIEDILAFVHDVRRK